MIVFFKKIFHKIGIDGAIALTILSRIVQAGGGLISIVFIAKYLSKTEQGYYYTFGSIIAVQIFFELGLSGIITQYTAHEFAHLSWSATGSLEGEVYYRSRLSSLLRFCLKWFGILSGFLFLLLMAVGYYFFSSYSTNSAIEWQLPWVVLCLATALNLFIDPILAFFDGLGEVKDMAGVRLWQKGIYVLALFIFFALGFKLYSSALASLVSIAINYGQIASKKRLIILKTILKAQDEWKLDYVKEIFPFQWRIALSWISGYFIFQLFNPVLFATEGAIVAGQMGMSLAALNGVSSISYSWINTKVPLLSGLIAKKDYYNLDLLFNKTLKNASFICGLGLSVFVAVVYFLQHQDIKLGDRFLPYLLLLLLCATAFANQLVYAMATYLRCHKQEPFLVLSIVIGVLSAISTLSLGRYFGVIGITVGYSFIIIVISLIWSVVIFKKKKALWHI